MDIRTKDTQTGALPAVAGARRQIGRYQVTAKLGEGGMGEVYRARDAKLGRDVALKLLPATLADNSQSMARLEREARTLASLNHPNIAAIYGLEESDGLRALVMELVEGETLSEHIRGASAKHLPPEEALPIAKQIAEAVEYAHERGVIHRDLKPPNVKITPEGTVKVLDFGLAKVLSDQDSMPPEIPANSPTLSLMATQAGIILGTAAYMAPEQAKGKPVDRRADIWAFGCVLFEMFAGKKPFDGETISEVLAAVIRAEPDWTALPRTTPPSIKRLIRRCLVKDPKQRLRDIGDARIAIEETLSGADAGALTNGDTPDNKGASFLRRATPWALGAVTIFVAAIATWLLLRPKPQENVFRFLISPPENSEFDTNGPSSISPDGRTLAFIAQSGPGKPRVMWLRSLDSVTAQPVAGTEGAQLPFWSPDGRQIAFGVGGILEKIAVSGGPPVTLCDMRNLSQPHPEHNSASAWNKDGVILFTNSGGIYQVSDSGGTPALVAAPDATRKESGFFLPQFLPDGRHFLVRVLTDSGPGMIGIGSLDSKSIVELGPASSNAVYAPPGFLFYLDQDTLMARPFDAGARRFAGPASPVAQNISAVAVPGLGFFSVSSTGVLVYQTALDTSRSLMAWFDRAGQNLGTVGQQGGYSTPALSPDGTRLAVAVGGRQKADIWVFDLKRGTASRLTFDAAENVNPIWSTDASQVFFSSHRNGPYAIYQKAANGLGSTQSVFQAQQGGAALNDLSTDGRYAIYDTAANSSTNQIWALPLAGNRKPFPVVQGSFGAASAQLSSNGRYVAYTSNETGREEVYVQTFPQPTGRWQISTSGGVQPTWRHDGKELFFLSLDQKLMSVDVNTTSGTLQAGIPKALFHTPLVLASYWRNIYVPSPDGQRFLMITPGSTTKQEPITVVVNWLALLKSGSK
jgi:serine/threonine protein kinase